LLTIKYNSGAKVNIIPEIISNRRFPILSAKKPTGKENIIPASGEAAAIMPKSESGLPSPLTKSGKTGFLEIVVEKIPKKPIKVIYHAIKLFFLLSVIKLDFLINYKIIVTFLVN